MIPCGGQIPQQGCLLGPLYPVWGVGGGVQTMSLEQERAETTQAGGRDVADVKAARGARAAGTLGASVGVCSPWGFRTAGARGQAVSTTLGPVWSGVLSRSRFFCGHPAPPEACDLGETPLPVTHRPALSPCTHGRSR